MQNRRHSRNVVNVTVKHGPDGAGHQGTGRDLSPGGMFVVTTVPIPLGADIDLQVNIDREDPVAVRGRVVRVTPEGVGVRFIGLMGPKLVEMWEKDRDRGEGDETEAVKT